MEEDDLAAMQAMQDELNVRKADSAQEQQLIGGDDDYMMPIGGQMRPSQRQPNVS